MYIVYMYLHSSLQVLLRICVRGRHWWLQTLILWSALLNWSSSLSDEESEVSSEDSVPEWLELSDCVQTEPQGYWPHYLMNISNSNPRGYIHANLTVHVTGLQSIHSSTRHTRRYNTTRQMIYLIFIWVFLPKIEFFKFPPVDSVEVVTDLFPSPRHTSFQWW